MQITLSKGGTKERTVDVEKIQVPDLWHIAMDQDDVNAREQILQTWHLAHDLLRVLREMDR